MTEVLFYHLTQTPLEATLPTLLQKSLERGWTVCVQGPNIDTIERLDRHLWTFDAATFLPHGISGGKNDGLQPILLTSAKPETANKDVLMLVDGATQDQEDLRNYTRVCVFFDGNNRDALSETRAYWTTLKDSGLDMRYWAQEDGRWVQKA